MTLEQKLDVLARCGLQLDPRFTVRDLLTSWTRDQFDKSDFSLALVALGMTEEQPPWRNHCVNAWHFDAECIEGHGAYCRIAERMKEMAQGSLPLENIRDHVDLETDTAWLAFDYKKRNIRIDCEVNDDWVDPAVFVRFVDLLAESDPTKIYLFFDLKGQDCIIACTTRIEFEQLRQAGVGFEPLHIRQF